jgi:DNA-binding CsgD family transcriptional regulator
MALLLRAAAKQGIAGNCVRRLLAAVSGTEHNGPVKQALIEPLSERELDVLRLLGTELDGPAIARELMVSMNTMRTHTKNIYAKLAVTNRRAAVRRPRNSTCCREPAAPEPDPTLADPGAERCRSPRRRTRSDEPDVPAAVSGVPETWRGLPSSDRAPSPESPRQSPGVVMPAHHIRP